MSINAQPPPRTPPATNPPKPSGVTGWLDGWLCGAPPHPTNPPPASPILSPPVMRHHAMTDGGRSSGMPAYGRTAARQTPPCRGAAKSAALSPHCGPPPLPRPPCTPGSLRWPLLTSSGRQQRHQPPISPRRSLPAPARNLQQLGTPLQRAPCRSQGAGAGEQRWRWPAMAP